MTIPTPEEFFLEHSLYKQFEFIIDNLKELKRIIFYDHKIDSFCIHCNKDSTFSAIDNSNTLIKQLEKNESFGANLAELRSNQYQVILKQKYFSKIFSCARVNSHNMIFNIVVFPKYFTKIGQYPSVADLNEKDIKKYKKVLDSQKLNEFGKAIGLYSHGIGIGSFVYLRRIFEDLIEQAHIKVVESKSIDEDLYRKSRMDEKITILKEYLPNFLLENKSIYSILSKGIHELSEDVCLNIFPPVRFGIEIMLDEKLRELEYKKKINEANKSLSDVYKIITDAEKQ